MKTTVRRNWFIGAILVAVIGTGIGFALSQTTSPSESFSDDPSVVDVVDGRAIRVTSGGVRYVVDPGLIVAGGPTKDGIPSIDQPQFVTQDEANEWIANDELVLVLTYKGVRRIYPLQILVWHEIVNDIVAGDPLLISYCPLCGSGIAYDRSIDGIPVEFGTSGNLYNSNLVMYDRLTDTYWSQIDGLALMGELAGEKLTPINLDTVVWQDWKATNQDAEVLSQVTGFDRDYGRDPYGSYYEASFIWFPVEGQDDRIHPKTVIFGIEVNGEYGAYREQDLIALGSIEDRIGGVRIRISRDAAGIVSVRDLTTTRPIMKERDFWFAWYAFHPDTSLYLPSGS